jgi:hypothetical protein
MIYVLWGLSAFIVMLLTIYLNKKHSADIELWLMLLWMVMGPTLLILFSIFIVYKWLDEKLRSTNDLLNS